jgi:hypothetical protein
MILKLPAPAKNKNDDDANLSSASASASGFPHVSMKSLPLLLSSWLIAISSCKVTTTAFCPGFTMVGRCSGSTATSALFAAKSSDDEDFVFASASSNDRRTFLISSTLATLPYLLLPPSLAQAASVPVQRAVGSAESKCRAEGNCLENFELDGAVGWNWGGTDRCDASNPLCGPDGRIRDTPLSGKPVPSREDDGFIITHVVELTLQIGSGSNADISTMKLGLYGQQCPELVKEMTELCSNAGLVTSKDLLLGAPVKLGTGGSLTYIVPEERLEFGVASQKVAYAKSIRKSKAPEEFVPQARPGGTRLQLVREEQSSTKHERAGLISVPKDGIGYGGGIVLGKDDEAYASAFQITAKDVLDMDKEGRKVIGQLIDGASMDLLARLAGSPTRKLIPGQNGGEWFRAHFAFSAHQYVITHNNMFYVGTPLIKVTVEDCSVLSVADLVAESEK